MRRRRWFKQKKKKTREEMVTNCLGQFSSFTNGLEPVSANNIRLSLTVKIIMRIKSNALLSYI